MVSSNTDLLFVTVVGKKPNFKGEVQTLIKKHVMRDIGIARRERKRVTKAITRRKPTPLRENEAKVETQMTEKEPLPSLSMSSDHRQPWDIYLESLFLASSIIPRNSELLLRKIYYFTTNFGLQLGIYREIWWALTTLDSAANDGVLAMFGAYIDSQVPVIAADKTHQARHSNAYVRSLRDINDRLSQPESRYSDGVIAAILSSIARSLIQEDFETASIHWKGLSIIIKGRGGLEAMNRAIYIPSFISCVDSTHAAIKDTAPTFPSSNPNCMFDLQKLVNNTKLPPAATFAARQWRDRIPHHEVQILLFEAVVALLVRVKAEFGANAYKKKKSVDPRAVDLTPYYLYIDILHTLQTHRHAASTSAMLDTAGNNVVADSTRIAVILCICTIRKAVGIVCAFSLPHLVRLRALLSGEEVDVGSRKKMMIPEMDAFASSSAKDVAASRSAISTSGTAAVDASSVSRMSTRASVESAWHGLSTVELWCLLAGQNIAMVKGLTEQAQWFSNRIEEKGWSVQGAEMREWFWG